MDVVAVRTFLAAASTGSFAAAAKRVHASPSAVTERIKQLEHLLRARLFERDKGGCRLTPAGHRFMGPAQTLVRAWEQGCASVSLPPRFTISLRVGGQYALWSNFMIPWLRQVRDAHHEVAIRAISAAAAQIDRDLENDDLDLAFLYEPVLREGLRIERLASDRLILLTANPDVDWRDNFTRTNWGEAANSEIVATLGELPNPGLEVDLGMVSLDWLMAAGASGFVPERLAWQHIRQGKLFVVGQVPTIDFSPFVCWRESLDQPLVGRLVEAAKHQMTSLTQ